MDKNIWLKPWFSINNIPNRICPNCGLNKLILDKKYFLEKETSNSIKHREYIDIEDFEYICVGLLYCNQCKESISITGYGNPEHQYWVDESGEHEDSYQTKYIPKYFNPALNIFLVSKKCPENIRESIKSAFSLYWIDNLACANKIRISIELILDTIKTPRKKRNSKRKMYRLNLHERIKIARIENGIKNIFLSLKWLGNEGSHDGAIPKEDLLDGFELLENILEEIYEKKTEKIKKISKKLNNKYKKKT